MNLPEQFQSVVARLPDRPAVSVRRDGGVERWTYRQLDDLARRAATSLRDAGIGPGDRCALLAGNDARWCAAYLGILRVGAIAVPLDTSYSAAQISALLRDSGASLLLTSARFEETARSAAAAAGCPMARVSGVVTAEPGALGPCPAAPSDVAVILYTSGTTDDPKGVMLTHGNLLAERDAVFRTVRVDDRDTVLGVLPLFHALAQVANLILPLSLGAHVVFLESLQTRELLRALAEEEVSIFCCVPQFFYLMHHRVTAEVGGESLLRRATFKALLRLNGRLRRTGFNAGPWLFPALHRILGPRMRVLITGGSSFDPAIGRDLYALGVTILQAYGLTETSGAVTVTRPGDPIDTVGYPLPSVEIAIDRQGSPAAPGPEGGEGEILVRGPIVMAGYWNRPEATARVLAGGWLHTGDLGRLDSHGRLSITGRRKEVIVLSSGKNVYPEEVEAHYRQSPFIAELCVLGLTAPDDPARERLFAIVVPDLDVLRQRRIVNTSELIRFELEGLSVALPPHKRVHGFEVTLEPLARTTTGKLKRYEILARYRATRSGAAAAAPRAESVEPHVAQVIRVVEQVVGPAVSVGPGSNLELDLGLDSMERVELLAMLEQRFGTRVPDDVAQSAMVVRDLAEVFRDATQVDEAGGELPWAALLDAGTPGPELAPFLKNKPFAAPAIFCLARVLAWTLARPRVSGLEHLPREGALIISPNHQSYLDPFVLVGVLPYSVFRRLFFVGAAEYFQTPLTRWLARLLNVVPVDPDANLVPAMRAGAFGLGAGKVLMLFPEGERSIDGTVKKFKKGAAILSQHLGVPIVPVAIDGVFEIWARGRPLNWRRLLPGRGGTFIGIGPPLKPREESYADYTGRLRERVDQLWSALRRRAV